MRKPIPSIPGYEIDHDGQVWSVSGNSAVKLPHGTHENRFGTIHLTVQVEGVRHFAWMILSSVIYGGGIVLPRDGNFLNLRHDRVIVLRNVSSDRITDSDAIHAIWRLYCEGTTCAMMEGRTGLPYGAADFKSVVKDVLWAGVK